jgi:hypothetical protein
MTPERIRRSLLSALYLSFLLLIFVAESLAQNTIHVPGDQPTIQSAINAAKNGDTVLVSSGTYTENINFGGKAITVTSASGPSVTILDGGANGSVVTFNTGEGLASVLNGFTIQNGKTSSSGAGIEIHDASPTIIGNIITNNHTIEGIGIEVNGGSPLIENNTITGNTQAGGDGGCGGGGIKTWGSSSNPASPTISGNTISNNSVSGGGNGGGIVACYYGSPIIQNNLIEGNYAYNYGGGIEIASDGGALVSQNVIEDNSVGGGGSGGGVAIYASSDVSLFNNTIVGNSAFDLSSGLYVGSASPLSNTIANNIVVASAGQTGAVCASTWSSLSPVFDHNDFFSATGAASSGVCNLSGTPGNITTDPLLADPVSLDLHLSTGSPAIDAGDDSISPIPSTDFDGAPRIVNGEIDMGAYEYQGATSFLVSPGSLGFNPQSVGTSSSTQPVTVTNTGAVTLHFHPMQIGSDFTQSNNCSGPNGLAIGQSCTEQVAFAPISPGTKSETLTISGANSASNGSVSLSGLATAPVASLSTNALPFNPQPLFTTSAAQTVTLTNTGNATMVVSSVVTTGDFAVTHNCATLSPGANCTASVTFTPTATGARIGTLSFNDNAAGSPHQVSLTGTGTGPEISFSSPSLAFPSESIGVSSSPMVLIVTNAGVSPLVFSSIQVSGSYTETNTCSTVPPAGTCQVSVTFTPAQYGSNPGALLFADNAAASPQTVLLSGTGLAPIGSLSPASVSFPGTFVVGSQSPAIPVFYSNSGNEALGVTSISTSANFSQTNNCGSYLRPATGCTISVFFTPSSTGALTGTLTVYDNASGSPRTVALSGQAVAAYPAPSLSSVSPNSLSIGASNQTLTLTGNGFFPASTVYWNGQAIPSTCVGPTSMTATPPAPTAYGVHTVTVVNSGPGGGTSNTLSVTAFQSLPFSARDLIYDPYRRVFYASIAPAATNSPNTITTIDPATGQTATLLSTGTNPSRLAISDDGQYLYVGVDGFNTIERVNLYTNQVDLNIPLGEETWGGFIAEDLKVFPGAPHSIAVVMADPNVDPEERGIMIYDDGKARGTLGATKDFISSIVFGADSSTLYGTTLSVSPPYLLNLSVGTSGVTPFASGWEEGGAVLQYLNGMLYGGTAVYDASTLHSDGTFTSLDPNALYPSVYPESGTQLAYLLAEPYESATSNAELFAASTFSLLAQGELQLSLPGVQSASTGMARLQRWGRDGLAFRYYAGSYTAGGVTPEDQVVMVRTAITNPSTSNNPAPAISLLSPSSVNTGSADLQLAVVGTNFVPGAVVQWNGADRTTIFFSSTQLTVYIPASDLAIPGTATIMVINPTPAGGTSNTSSFSITTAYKATPVVTWASPASITYGNALSATQLNAAASVPGTFVYQPAAGTILGAGTQTLSVTFMPADTTDYRAATTTTSLVVAPALPLLSWPAPAAIVSGTPLSSVQLDATASVPGTFVYNPTAGTVLPVGTQTLSVTFTPTDGVDYAPANASTTIPVLSVSQTMITLSSLSSETATAGGAGFTLTAYGENFTPTSQIEWDGGVRQTTYINSSQLAAEIGPGDIANVADVKVSVTDVMPVSRTSVSQPFEVQPANPVPEIDGCAIANVADASGNYTLTITGRYFASDTTMQWNGTTVPAIYLGPWTLSATLTAAQFSAAGPDTVTVVNPSGSSSFTLQ